MKDATKDVTRDVTDESLVEAALNGDNEAFIRLVSRHKGRVIGLAARFTGIRQELDDICQDVFMKAYGRLRSYQRTAPFEHWLSRIAVNTCYDYLRKKKHVAPPPPPPPLYGMRVNIRHRRSRAGREEGGRGSLPDALPWIGEAQRTGTAGDHSS